VAPNRGRDLARHALGVEVEQREGGPLLTVDDGVASPSDDVARLAIKLSLGDGLYLFKQAGAKCAKRDSLTRFESVDHRCKLRDVSNLDAPCFAARHYASATVALDRAIGG
jgi:hypothetical protein